ncbi:MAG: hypothetical protein KGZ93_00330 [Actinobacteria bacterium]|nr:hypothetical protein [Actinomycetota bacterium]
MTRSASEWIPLIQEVLSPDLLKSAYVIINKGNPMYGHCYAATEALYYLLGGKESGWQPCRGKDAEGVTHWWLRNADGQILDPTVEQYTTVGKKPPYASGRNGPFLTQQPSKRANEIIARVKRINEQNRIRPGNT